MSDCRRIDGPWRFFRGARELAHEATCDDSAWQEAVLPHTWNADDMAPGRSMLDASVGESWYRVHLPLRKAPNQRYLIRIEAAAFRSDVWCNGMFVGGSDDGFLPSRYDITDCLADGDDQVLAVRVDNRFHPGSMPPPVTDWERYGGLIRPVWLERRGVSYFEDGGCAPRVVRLGDDSAEVVFRTRVWSWHGSRESRSATVRHRVYAPDGSIAAEASCPVSLEHGRTAASRCTAMIDRPRRWDVDDPLLYRVHSELVVGDDVIDTDEQPLGFRDIRWDADTGFFLNGRRLELAGVNAHLDYPGLGHAVPERFGPDEARRMRAAGFNVLRGSHYPRSREVLRACDEHGLLLIEELPFWHGSCRAAYGQALLDYARRRATALVRWHGNHPCIIAWNTVNEVMHVPGYHEAHLPPGMRTGKHKLPAEEWPYARRVLSALYDAFKAADPERAVSMVVGGSWRQNHEADTPALADLIGCNGGVMHQGIGNDDWTLDTLHRLYPATPIYMSEGLLNHGDIPRRAEWDKELQHWQTMADAWDMLYAREWFCGGTMWVWADYSAKGAYRLRGCLDYRRLELESYFFFRSQWQRKLNVHINGHCSGYEGKGERDLWVFHNGERVELFCDGRCLGSAEPGRERWPHLPHPPSLFRVPLDAGHVRVVAYRGNEHVEDERHREGTPARLEIIAEGEELQGGRGDARFFTAIVHDAGGNRCYLADGELRVTYHGSALLAGPSAVPLRGGLARWAVRSNGTGGSYAVRALFDRLEGSFAGNTV